MADTGIMSFTKAVSAFASRVFVRWCPVCTIFPLSSKMRELGFEMVAETACIGIFV